MILLSDLFSLVVWSRSLGSNNPESLMNTHINVPGAGREIIGSSMGSSASHGPSISTAQAVVLLFSALLLPIFVPLRLNLPQQLMLVCLSTAVTLVLRGKQHKQ